jgi:DNA adenine methylase
MACRDFSDAAAFVYFDPPYRPTGPTANFTAYSPDAFDATQQLRLAEVYRALAQRGAYLMLSNSDPLGLGSADPFYAAAYAGFRLEKVQARRRINSRPNGRGAIDEVLILNYAPDAVGER